MGEKRDGRGKLGEGKGLEEENGRWGVERVERGERRTNDTDKERR